MTTALANTPKYFSRKYAPVELFIIGVLCIAGVPYEWVYERYGVSKSYYYALRVRAQIMLDILFAFNTGMIGLLQITPTFIERCVVGLQMYCKASVQGIGAFFDNVLMYHVSRGKIYEISRAACWKAFEFNAAAELSNIIFACIDEIFLKARGKGVPVLTGVDPHSLYVFLASHVRDRTSLTWAQMLEQLKAQGFHPQMFLGDLGNGLNCGADLAFNDVYFSSDVFHVGFNLGKAISSIIRHVDSDLKQFDKCTKTIANAVAAGRKPNKRTVANLEKLPVDLHTTRIEKAIMLLDLKDWFKEVLEFNGYSYDVNLRMGNWVLDEMSALYPNSKNLQKAINGAREALPKALEFQHFFEKRLADDAKELGVSLDDQFLLYYQHNNHRTDNYEWIEQRLWKRYGTKLADAREKLADHIDFVVRASSSCENFNSRYRTYADVKNDNVSSFMDELIVCFENTKKQGRSRKGRGGTSAYDRLTGETHPEFLDILYGTPDYTLVRAS